MSTTAPSQTTQIGAPLDTWNEVDAPSEHMESTLGSHTNDVVASPQLNGAHGSTTTPTIAKVVAPTASRFCKLFLYHSTEDRKQAMHDMAQMLQPMFRSLALREEVLRSWVHTLHLQDSDLIQLQFFALLLTSEELTRKAAALANNEAHFVRFVQWLMPFLQDKGHRLHQFNARALLHTIRCTWIRLA